MYLARIKIERFLHLSLVGIMLHHTAAQIDTCDIASLKRVDATR
jgi:hypothetical protein